MVFAPGAEPDVRASSRCPVSVTDEPPASVIDLFEVQVTRTPEAIALVNGETRVSYAELDRAANRLAHHLIALGLGPEGVVALALERSPEMVTAILAVLKSGAAYLPLDPGLPADRVAFLLADCGAAVTITATGVLGDICLAAGAQVIVLDTPDMTARLLGCSDRAPTDQDRLAPLRSANLAYLIYTSGSTGRPKGVAISHGNLARLHATARGWFEFGADDIWALFHSYAFDVSVWELWAPLLHGGRLVIVDDDTRLSAEALLDLLAEQRVTGLCQTPSAFYPLLDSLRDRRPPALSLRRVIFAGEALDFRRLAPWYEHFADDAPVMVNMYGPTEATVYASFMAIDRTLAAMSASLIGRALPDMGLLVLDATLSLVPAGMVGELYIAGAGLARGYLNRPGLTAERFIACPYGPSGARIYRSGDLARWGEDGVLEFLGRIDDQVKIRGFRIEPGEIEARLLSCEGIREAVVLAREDTAGDKRLVAYYTTAAGADGLEARTLREHVQASLPDYMVPAAYVRLERLPLTPNGKLDRKALPAPEDEAYAARGYEPPRGYTEETVARIWAEVLGFDRVGRHDNFFELGGHSLLAIRLVARIRRQAGLEAPLRLVFEHPTPAALARALDQVARDTSTSPRRGQGDLPDGRVVLSAGQVRLWAIDQRDGPSGAYNMVDAWRLTGPLNLEALGLALVDLVARHTPLRTVIEAVEGVPAGRLLAPPDPRDVMSLEDIFEPSPSAVRDAVSGALAAEAARPFDLSRDLMIRAHLLRVGADDHVLALTTHHAASDGVSQALINGELAAAYAARVLGRAPDWPALAIAYADHAAWAREGQERGGRMAAQIAYWRQTLAGAPETLVLPTDRRRTIDRDRRPGVVPIVLEPGRVLALESLAQGCGATLFAALLAGWASVLGRLSGQADLVIGAPVAGRDREETEGVVGFFVNTLPLRLDLSGRPTVTALVARARDTAFGALAHQDVPFEKVVEALVGTRSASESPLVQVMFAWQTQETTPLVLAGLAVSTLEPPRAQAKFDIGLNLAPRSNGGIDGVIEFDASLFDEATVSRWACYLTRTLEGMAAGAPGSALFATPVALLPILDESERGALVEGFNVPAGEPPRMGLAGCFAVQAAATPRAVALIGGDQTLSYGDLDIAANRLAHRLILLGVGSESVVGLALDRSVGAIVAMLAIVKAGGAYLPIRPSEPLERLRFMLRDSGARLVVGDLAFAGAVADIAAVVRLDGPAESAAVASCPETSPGGRLGGLEVAADTLAYVIYTSGSTGAPKGVAVTQGAVVSLVSGQSYAPLGPDRTVLQLAPLAFDAATFEIWGALLNGARLVLAPPGAPDLDDLCQIVAAQRVDTLWLTAGLFAQVVDSHPRMLAGLRRLLAGGDVLPVSAAAKVSALYPDLSLVNGYGPTETTTFASTHLVGPENTAGGPIPIGRPIAGAQAYVLDAGLSPVPLGVAGELHISGAGLARGYLARPGLTAERFIACPFGRPGGRMYRTGDLARWRADGVLEFLGRIDDQVKVRGFRVEPGEIEAALMGIVGVGQAVVIPRQVAGETRLVAYLAGGVDRARDLAAVRSALAARLPDYMIPARFIVLDALPLTPNGKLDRQALPEPDVAGGRSRPPANEAEAGLLRLFQDLTGARGIGVDDNFFDVGGHSLLGVRLMFEIDKAFGKKLPLGVLFEAPTVALLAQRLGRSGEAPGSISLVPLHLGGEGAPLFMVHWIERELARHLGARRPVFALSFGLAGSTTHDDLPLPERIEDIAAHYIAEMRSVQPHGPYHLIGHSAGGLVAYEMARQLADQGEPAGLVGLLDTHIPPERSARKRVGPARLAANVLRTPPAVLLSYLRGRVLGRIERIPMLRALMIKLLPAPATLRLRLVNAFMFSYRPAPLHGKVHLFKSMKAAFHIRTEPPPPPELAWMKLALEGVEVHEIPGGHLDMVRNPTAAITAAAIETAIKNS